MWFITSRVTGNDFVARYNHKFTILEPHSVTGIPFSYRTLIYIVKLTSYFILSPPESFQQVNFLMGRVGEA